MSKFEIFKNEDEENNSKEKSNSPESPYYRLLKSRVITIYDTIDSKLAKEINAQLLFLEQEDPEKLITVFINSPGGEIFSGFSIFDTMSFIQPKVRTIAAGLCASIAIIILLGGEKGQRFAFPNSRLLIHQPSIYGQIFGQASDLEIAANEIMMAKERINQIISNHTGRPIKKVIEETERDYWLSPEDSIKYGLIDKIITNRSDIA